MMKASKARCRSPQQVWPVQRESSIRYRSKEKWGRALLNQLKLNTFKKNKITSNLAWEVHEETVKDSKAWNPNKSLTNKNNTIITIIIKRMPEIKAHWKILSHLEDIATDTRTVMMMRLNHQIMGTFSSKVIKFRSLLSHKCKKLTIISTIAHCK